jgi:hypothetical protein
MDFHNMIGKLRAIESLGEKTEYVAEDAPESAIAGKCNMTAEGKSCPVHGMVECWSAPMEEGDAATLESMLKNSGQIAEAGGIYGGGAANKTVTPPTAQDSGETWADWFSRIYGGGQTVATGGDVSTPGDTGGVTGNPMGDYTGVDGSTPTSVKPAVEPTVASKPPVPTGSMPAAKTVPAPAVGGARPDTPAAGMPAAPEPATFKDAFRAARKAAGGAGGVFMWKGKPYQTNVKGEPAKAWNSPELKKVGSGWPTSESAGRKMKSTRTNAAEMQESLDRLRELSGMPDDSVDQLKVDDMAADMSADAVDEMFYFPRDKSPKGQREHNKPHDILSVRNPGDVVKYGDEYKYMRKGKSPDAQRMKAAYSARGPKHALPEDDDMAAGMTIEDLMRKYGVEEDDSMVDHATQNIAEDDQYSDITGSDDELAMADYGRKVLEGVAKLCKRLEKADPGTLTQLATDEDMHASGDIGQFLVDNLNMDVNEFSKFEEILDEFGGDPIVNIFAAWKEGWFNDYLDAWKRYAHEVLKKRNVGSSMHEDAPLNGMPFTSLGATNNGPEEWGMVVTGGTNTNNFNESKKLKEGFTINSNMDVRDGKVTKSLSINATDDDVDTLAAMLRNAGMGDHVSVHNQSNVCGKCGNPANQCTCGMNQTAMCDACSRPLDACTCGMAMENADHDYGHNEKSEIGEPLDVEEYVWDGPRLNQRFGKIGDNTLMAERAITLFKNYSDQYTQMLEEADLDPSNAGFDSPLTANSRDEFDKDPFVDDKPVDDGTRSPLSTVKRQDVMN